MHDVFISYSSQDKPIADAVCAGLEARGIRCWIAPRDILAGMEWGQAIVEAIGSAKVMVLLLSASANKSSQIPKEVDRATNKGVPVLPLRIENVQPAGALEYYLGPAHWLDAITPPVQAHIDRLAETIGALLLRGSNCDRSKPALTPAAPVSPASPAARLPPRVPPRPPAQRSQPGSPPPRPAPPRPVSSVAPPAKPLDDNVRIVLYVATALVPILGIVLFFVYNNSQFESDRKAAKIMLIIGIVSLVLSMMFGCFCVLAQGAAEGNY
jgi:hypothetical protein